jgi:membrane protease YdiL (CAAX protease family)
MDNHQETIEPPPISERSGPVAGWRWAIHLLVLILYPLSMGALAFFRQPESDTPLLPSGFLPLVATCMVEMTFFGFIFSLAWLASRIRLTQLYFRAESPFGAVSRGFLWSIGLRLLISVFLVGASELLAAAQGGKPTNLEAWRAHTEALVNAQDLVDQPVFLWMNLTVVSFVLGGFREEIWRAGTVAGWFAVFPSLESSWTGRAAAVTMTAAAFGLGHVAQWWGGVVMTSILGLGLGFVLIWRNSIWEAILAHGFFNATTFALLYLIARYRPDMVPGQS